MASSRSDEALRLLCALAVSLEHETGLAAALAAILRQVCRSCGWAAGDSWIPDARGEALVPGPSWSGTEPRLRAFARGSRVYRFRRGEGLPGRVWRARRPAWVRDVRCDANFPRRRLARAAGLRAGLAVPVLAGSRLVAVLEFFSRRRQEEDRARLRVVAAVAAQLGALLRRRDAESSLRRSRLALAAREAERQRLARELHDGVGQILASAAFRLGRADAPRLRPVRRLVASAVSEIRRLARNLGPAPLRDLGLVAAARLLGRELAGRSGLVVRVEDAHVPPDLPADVSLDLYRVLQEAMSNVERHAGARAVTVRLEGRRGRLRLRVSDDGRGFDPDAPPRRGLGLRHLQERAALLGGELRLSARPGRGTVVDLVVPWRRRRREVS